MGIKDDFWRQEFDLAGSFYSLHGYLNVWFPAVLHLIAAGIASVEVVVEVQLFHVTGEFHFPFPSLLLLLPPKKLITTLSMFLWRLLICFSHYAKLSSANDPPFFQLKISLGYKRDAFQRANTAPKPSCMASSISCMPGSDGVPSGALAWIKPTKTYIL